MTGKNKIKIDWNDIDLRSNHDDILEQAYRLLKGQGNRFLKKKYYPEMELKKHKIRLNEYCGEIDILALDGPVLSVVEVKSNGNAIHHAALQLKIREKWILNNREIVEKYVLGGRSFDQVESIVCYEDIDSDHPYNPPYWLVLQYIEPNSPSWNNGGNGHDWKKYDPGQDEKHYRKSILGDYRRISERTAKKIAKEMRNHSF